MPVATPAQTATFPLRSVAQMIAAMFCFAVVDALAKSITAHYPASEITFFRMLFGLAPALVLAMQTRAPRHLLRTRHWRGRLRPAGVVRSPRGRFFSGPPA